MPSNRRIALFVPSLEGGGAERVMVLLANGLARRGLPVDLVVLRPEGAFADDVSPSVRLVALPARRVLGSAVPLARYLRRERPVALISAMNYVNVIAVTAASIARTGVHLVLTEHANLARSLDEVGGRLAVVLPALMRWAYRRADAIVAVSEGVARSLVTTLRLAPERVSVCGNPVDTEWVANRSLEVLDHPWARADALPLVLSVGRLSPEKDHRLLLEAFERARARAPMRLVILGEGPERPWIEGRIARSKYRDDIFLAGFERNPYRWMRAAAALVLTSRWEGFGNVLVEAMACGTPVISTDCESGPSEILSQGRWGRMVPVGDADALAAAMVETLESPPVSGLVERARSFGVEGVIDRYLRVLPPPLSTAG